MRFSNVKIAGVFTTSLNCTVMAPIKTKMLTVILWHSVLVMNTVLPYSSNLFSPRSEMKLEGAAEHIHKLLLILSRVIVRE